jgi:hypothetical protein
LLCQLDLWKFSVWTGASALYNSNLPFFLGSLEKKSNQNLGRQSTPLFKLLENIPEYTKENKIKSKLILIYTVLNKK